MGKNTQNHGSSEQQISPPKNLSKKVDWQGITGFGGAVATADYPVSP